MLGYNRVRDIYHAWAGGSVIYHAGEMLCWAITWSYNDIYHALAGGSVIYHTGGIHAGFRVRDIYHVGTGGSRLFQGQR